VSSNLVSMEMLPLHGTGQGYGFVLYRASIPIGSKSIQVQLLKDFGIVSPFTRYRCVSTGPCVVLTFQMCRVLIGTREMFKFLYCNGYL